VDVLKLFASIALKTVGLQQLLHHKCNNTLLRNISSDSCHVVGKWPLSNATVELGEE